ncbi:MAG: hypothetical protein C5S47_05825 [Candidatus Methanogasteraceae archaeon]|nr:MAG: hypothetical protein C5S47_05825 [ANME-2 cluster archaeon]
MIPVIFMQMKAIYRDHVLKPLTKLDLPEETTVRIVRGSFSELLDESGELEAKKGTDKVLADMRI